MKPFWIRIAAGIALVFVLGMFGVALAREGKGYLRRLATQGSLSVPLAVVPFTVDGTRFGTLHGVDIRRERGTASNRQITLRVRLEGDRTLPGVTDCAGLAVGGEGDGHDGFTCVSITRMMGGDLRRIGTIDFANADLRSRPLLVPRAVHDEVTAALRGARVEITTRDAQDPGRVVMRGFPADDASLRLDRAPDRADLVVRDAEGRAVVQLHADAQGGVLRVRDQRGKDVVRIEATTGSH